MTSHDELAAAVQRFQALLATDRQRAVANLRHLEERWARLAAGLPAEGDLVAATCAAIEVDATQPAGAADAIEHLAAAERWQWEIGTWATGSGEGLASMFAVRTLQLARAGLLASRVAVDPAAAAEAARLLAEVAGDPNDIAARHRRHIETLRRRLASSRGG